MKHMIPLLLLLLLLTSCALAPDEYLSVTPHEETGSQEQKTDAVSVEDEAGLRRAILGFISRGQTEGTIRVTNYDGDVEEDLAKAAYEMAKLNPLGAYAVDYMTHNCTYIVNYYEITIRITFRRTAREIADIEYVATEAGLQFRLRKALNEYDDRIAVRVSNYREPDVETTIAEYCAEHPGTIMEQPRAVVSVYPDSGEVRIVEINLQYTQSAAELQRKKKAVDESIDAAAEYIRYRETDREKAELLFTYLLERFTYEAGETVTPVYDALCSGIADPQGLTHAWQLICDQAGVECYTVTGLRNGEEYIWNIVCVDGDYRHLDLAQCVLENGSLVLQTDPEMGQSYYWNSAAYPACEPALEQPPAEVPAAPPAEKPATEKPI